MPNWCSNQATIHGTKEQILELAGAYERGAVIQNYLPVPEDVEDKIGYCRNHWGTKWDFGKTEYTADEECDWQVDEEGYGLVHLRFETAWSPPIGWYEALNKLDMTVEAYYFEPGMALTDKDDGLSFYRSFAAGAPDHLNPGGILIVEVGADQASDVVEVVTGGGRLVHRTTIKDRVVGHERVVVFELSA